MVPKEDAVELKLGLQIKSPKLKTSYKKELIKLKPRPLDERNKIKTNFKFWVILFCIIILACFAAPILPLQDPLEVDLNQVLQAPNLNHYFGTDSLGRDVFARVLYGGIVSLSIATIATTAGIGIGIIYGGLSGYIGGKTDAILMRFVEILYAIPSTIIILCFQMMVPNKVVGLVVIMSLTSWMTMARVIRGRFMELKQKEFVALARGMNTPTWKILFNHLARNSVSSIIIVFTFTFSSAIMNEAALSFLGVGVPQEIPSWGNMIFNAQNYILTGVWWAALFPGIMIVLSTMCVNYISEDLKNKYLYE